MYLCTGKYVLRFCFFLPRLMTFHCVVESSAVMLLAWLSLLKDHI